MPLRPAMTQESRDISTLLGEHAPGFALPQRFYTDPAIYELELERVIARNWIVAGHQSELPAEGDFKVVNVANESAIIVRGKDGRLRAFANVCRHRGSLVCLESSGNADRFMCPYHGWVYATDGKLTAQFEHTLVVTSDGVEIMTLQEGESYP